MQLPLRHISVSQYVAIIWFYRFSVENVKIFAGFLFYECEVLKKFVNYRNLTDIFGLP